MDKVPSYPLAKGTTDQRVVPSVHDQRRRRSARSAQKRILVAALAIVILAALLAGAFLGDLWTFGDEGLSVKGIEELVRSWGALAR